MNIGIVGLGLIGGSLAKAICRYRPEDTVWGMDKEASTELWAKAADAIHHQLQTSDLGVCDMVIVALYPGAAIRFLQEQGERIRKGAVVVDCCGVKKEVCQAGWQAAEKHGFHFVGGHPMAGIERSGFGNAQSEMFAGASMILTPKAGEDIARMDEVKRFFLSIGFGQIQISTPEKHDAMIAFTSQLAHIVSGAYVKSPAAMEHHGYSAGSYRDMTRVATLNETMWAELFLRNKENLLREIDTLADNLATYRAALEQENEKVLKTLLRESTIRKGQIDGGA